MATETDKTETSESTPEPQLGARLGAARQDQDLSLEKAAASLRVDVAVLQNLESENFSALGAQVFVRGHLRKYAKLLNLPEQELLDAYQAKVGESVTQLVHPVLRQTVPMARRRRRMNLSLVLLLVLVLSLFAAAAWWWSQMRAMDGGSQMERSVTGAGSSLVLPPAASGSVDLAVPRGAAGSTASPSSQDSQQVNLPAADNAGTTVAQDKPAEQLPATVDTPTTAAVEQVKAETPGVQMTLVLDFVEDSWAEIHDGRQKRVLYGLFRAGTRRELQLQAPASVYLGHVQGVTISVDGASFDVPRTRRVGNTARFTIDPPR